jgi:uncharacterized cysteine cluster protein YcgN (CxxCxxCC family)
MIETLRPDFWTNIPLGDMNAAEWEALCDGCGKCCLNKLEDIDTGELILTRVACKLFDDSTCRCSDYANRKRHVPECVVLRPDNLDEIAYWMPETCAYRRLHYGHALPDWHPLLTGDPDSPHQQPGSIRNRCVSERDIPLADWEDYPL